MKKTNLKNIIKEFIQEFENTPRDHDLGWDIEDDLFIEESNSCRQEGFCCKHKVSLKTTNAVLEGGQCTCPKRSSQINCPK